MEADLAAGTGGVTAEDVQAQRDKAQKERQEAVEAVQKAKEERAEATAGTTQPSTFAVREIIHAHARNFT